MEIFSQNKLLIRCVIFLALLNVFSISVFLWKEFHHGPLLFPKNEDYHDVSGILQRELDLSPEQAAQIKALRSEYFDRESLLTQRIRSERDAMNEQMFNKNTDTNVIKSLAREIVDNEYQVEMLRFEQAQKLKAICTAHQLEKFEQLVKEIRDYFRPDNQPKRR